METDSRYTLLLGDCLLRMKELPDNSVDSIVTDPPYALSFMRENWDNPKMMGQASTLHGGLGRYAPGEPRTGYDSCDNIKFQEAMLPIFKEALRVAKPGAHLLAFGGTRTYHRLACAIEDAGWEVRDCTMYVHSQGFPKGQNVAKQIDAQLKHGKSGSRYIRDIQETRPGEGVIGNDMNVNGILSGNKQTGHIINNNPMTPEATKWNGWNSQLKPALEPIVIARKPPEGTIASNILKYGVGAYNIDGCRIPTEDNLNGGAYGDGVKEKRDDGYRYQHGGAGEFVQPTGRYPSNLIHDGSDEVLALFPDSNGSGPARVLHRSAKPDLQGWGMNKNAADEAVMRDCGSGSAARFFYCAKASRKEKGKFNTHPTCKPLALMRYLVRLVTPKDAVVLDPFMGSGTTGLAAVAEGCRFIGIEKEREYYAIAQRRMWGNYPEGGSATGASEDEDEQEPVEKTVAETNRQMELNLI